MELLEVYDMFRNKTGELLPRNSKEWGKGKFHCVSVVFIFNSKGEVLLQRRAFCKKYWGGKWDFTACGAVDPGENTQQAGMREVKEELGLDVDLTNVRPHFTVHFDGWFTDIFFIDQDVDISKVVLQETEVDAVKWANRDEVRSLFASGNFVDYFPEWIELAFACHNVRGIMDFNRREK